MLKSILKKATTKALRLSLREVVYESRKSLLHSKGLWRSKQYRSQTELRLHLGCGPKVKEGWVNIDLNKKANLTLDLREALPFSSDSCAILYCEHFLEHVDYPEPAMSLCTEVHRILQRGGIFSIGVPDSERALRAYCAPENASFFEVSKKWHASWCTTRMEHINYHFRQDTQHRFCYDFETLKYVLEKAGFGMIQRRAFDPLLDSAERESSTLYVNAVKLAAQD